MKRCAGDKILAFWQHAQEVCVYANFTFRIVFVTNIYFH